MNGKRLTIKPAFTIIELMIAAVLAIVALLGISIMLADSQRGWNRMYSRIYSDVATDSYVARKAFDGVIRKASREKYLLDDAGAWIEVYYYADANSAVVDRYARFFCVGEPGGTLNVEHGGLDPRETLTISTICGNVSSCDFSASGRSAQMVLILDNGSQTATVTTSAVMHNQ